MDVKPGTATAAVVLAAALVAPAAHRAPALATPSSAQGPSLPAAPESDRLTIREALPGGWVGEGSLFGQPAGFRMTWSEALDGRFLELSYRIEGAVEMEARGFYRFGDDGTVDGTWVDSRGEILSIRGTVGDSALEIEWASPSESGRTVYRWLADGGVEVADAVRVGAEWRPFGAAVYARSDTR